MAVSTARHDGLGWKVTRQHGRQREDDASARPSGCNRLKVTRCHDGPQGSKVKVTDAYGLKTTRRQDGRQGAQRLEGDEPSGRARPQGDGPSGRAASPSSHARHLRA